MLFLSNELYLFWVAVSYLLLSGVFMVSAKESGSDETDEDVKVWRIYDWGGSTEFFCLLSGSVSEGCVDIDVSAAVLWLVDVRLDLCGIRKLIGV